MTDAIVPGRRRVPTHLLGYLLRRALYALLVVWAAYTITFLLLYALPSNPIDLMISGNSEGVGGTSQQREQLLAEYGFDQPLIVQYFTQLSAAASGDFGRSLQSGRPVVEIIAEVLPETVKLSALALALSVFFALLIALFASYRRSGWLRAVLTSLPPLANAVPTFWIGLLLLIGFAFQLRLFPSAGNEGVESLVLPALTLAIPGAAGFAQVLVKSLDDASLQPNVEVLRSRGLPYRGVYLRHVLHNALIPTLTLFALNVGGLIAGSVVTETIYSRKGAGRLLQEAINQQDLPVVQILVLLSAVLYAAVNLVVDWIYPLVDPRIRRPQAVAA